MKKILALLLALLLALASPAFGQAVQQSSPFVTPGHVATWVTNGVIGDGGPVGGGATLSGNFTLNDFVCANATSSTPSIIDCGLSATGTNNWTSQQNLNGGGTSTTPAQSDSSTKIATTAFVTGTATSAARTRLTANTTFYVSTGGTDSNTCTVGAPCLTIQRAYDNLANFYDLSGYTATIQLANGTYSAGLLTSKPVPGGNGPGSIIILGNATPSNVVVSVTSTDAFGFGEPAAGSGSSSSGTQLTLAGIKIIVATSGNAITANGGSTGIVVGSPGFPVEFGSTAQDHIIGSHGAWVIAGTNNLVSGGALIHVAAISNAVVALHNTTETYSNSPVFTYWGYAESNGSLFVDNMVFTNGNTVTGTRYFANLLGTIYACPVISGTCSPASTYLPGSSSGVALNGGFYLAGPSSQWLLVQGGTGSDLSATGGTSQVLKQTTVGGSVTVGQLACSDLSNGATGCSTATGTSGATIPLLNGNNTYSGTSTFSGQMVSTFGVPTIGSGNCGSGSNGTISGTNQSGIITIGASATTTCTISFSTTITAPGACVIFPGNATAAAQGTTLARVGTPSATQWVITGASNALASTVYSYICL